MSNQLRLNTAIDELERVGVVVGALRGLAHFTEGMDLQAIRRHLVPAVHSGELQRALPAVAGAGGASVVKGLLEVLGAAGSFVSGVLMTGDFLEGVGDGQPSAAIDAAAREQSEHERTVEQSRQSTDHAVHCMEAMDGSCVAHVEKIVSTTCKFVRLIRGALGDGAGPMVVIEPILHKAVSVILGILQRRNASLEGCMDALIDDHQKAAQPGNSAAAVCQGKTDEAESAAPKRCDTEAAGSAVQRLCETDGPEQHEEKRSIEEAPSAAAPNTTMSTVTVPPSSGMEGAKERIPSVNVMAPIQPAQSLQTSPLEGLAGASHNCGDQRLPQSGLVSSLIGAGSAELSSLIPAQNCPPQVPTTQDIPSVSTSQDIQHHIQTGMGQIHAGVQQGLGKAAHLWDQFAGAVNESLCPPESNGEHCPSEPTPCDGHKLGRDEAEDNLQKVCPPETEVEAPCVSEAGEREACSPEAENQKADASEQKCEEKCTSEQESSEKKAKEKDISGEETQDMKSSTEPAEKIQVSENSEPPRYAGFDKSSHPSVPVGAVDKPVASSAENLDPNSATTQNPTPEQVTTLEENPALEEESGVDPAPGADGELVAGRSESNTPISPVDPEAAPGRLEAAPGSADPHWSPDIWVSGLNSSADTNADGPTGQYPTGQYVRDNSGTTSVAASSDVQYELLRSGQW
ncbi:hypothetical protein [Corynebacterium anserum]|uniref:Uncharacterized protein n=1 Tax=Corynebacterium anserum TaxID=2684406 RepID=A0A7G7YPX4_9CORY|nr:hypothetical protein [Corynebacterium anserum]QNH96544.1 hypothetical protein GP473_07635 [Corynebacterium anserum]